MVLGYNNAYNHCANIYEIAIIAYVLLQIKALLLIYYIFYAVCMIAYEHSNSTFKTHQRCCMSIYKGICDFYVVS